MSDGILQQHQISSYRRGTILGLTAAEAFMLISFILLLVLMLWKVLADEKLARADRISNLDADLIVDRLRLVEKEHLRRLAEAAQRLPDEVLLKLTDMAKTANIAEKLKQYEDLLSLGKSPEELRQALQQLELMPEMSRELAAYRQANLSPEQVLELKAAVPNIEQLAEMTRELDAYKQVKLSPEEVQELKTAMQHLATAQQRLDSTGADVARQLREKAGERIATLGGRILEDGDVIFPDKVLFEVGSARITPAFDHLLAGFCRPWFEVLYNEDRFLETVQIEGHASSEFGNLPGRTAFDANLDLSQQRAAAVFKRCLDYGGNDEVARWAHSKLAAVGYSSARLVLIDGKEDRDASRRVVFAIDMRSQDDVLTGIFAERTRELKSMDPKVPPTLESPAQRVPQPDDYREVGGTRQKGAWIPGKREILV